MTTSTTTTTENPPDPPRPAVLLRFRPIVFLSSRSIASYLRLSVFVACAAVTFREFSRLLTILACRVQSTDWPPRGASGGSPVGAFESKRARPNVTERRRTSPKPFRVPSAGDPLTRARAMTRTILAGAARRAFTNLLDATRQTRGPLISRLMTCAARYHCGGSASRRYARDSEIFATRNIRYLFPWSRNRGSCNRDRCVYDIYRGCENAFTIFIEDL